MLLILLSALSCAFASAGAPMPPLNNPCVDPKSSQSSQLWCDSSQPVEARVKDMISRMTIAEKIANLDTQAPAIASLDLNAYNWWSEATHGISHVNNSGSTPGSTNFAFPITTAASFNRSLWRATGAAIAREARAFMNAGHAYSTFWAPVVNLAREPRWGRNLECAGEDPYLSGQYAAAFVQGFEHLPEEPRYLAASACCKHFVANSMEDSRQQNIHHTRYSADPNITMRDLVDSYMAPFQACVEQGKVSSLMCSYNSVNGKPSCANPWLLDTVARDSWGFDGYLTSDCDAVANVVSPHHFVETAEEAVAVTLKAGMDIDCSYFVGQHGQSALDKGLIDEDLIDMRLSNLFKVRMRLGHFDPPGPLSKIPASAICSEEAAAVARDGVAQGAVLLKNDVSTLPLSAKKLAAAGSTVAVIGPNANLSEAIAGYYGPRAVCGGAYPNMVDAVAGQLHAAALRRHHLPGSSNLSHRGTAGAATVATALGVPSVSSDDTSGVPAAAALAREAAATILVLGTDTTVAKENKDATNITFSAGQLALVAAVTAASLRPVVVVTLTAVPLDLTPLIRNPKVGAILHAGQVSVQVDGVADVLFGAKSPAGRAVQMVYPEAYQHQISPFDFNMRPGPSVWPRPDSPGPCPDPMYGPPVAPGNPNCTAGTNPGRTYRFFADTKSTVVPFGYGLSYSTFSYKVVEAPESVSLDKVKAALAQAQKQHGSTAFLTQQQPQQQPQQQDQGRGLVLEEAQYVVNVTNTGPIDADDVVLGFIAPPGAGTGGLPLKALFGFERVHVKAGETVTVTLYPGLADFAPVAAPPGASGVTEAGRSSGEADDDGSRRALSGDYVVSFGVPETAKSGMGFAQVPLNAF